MPRVIIAASGTSLDPGISANGENEADITRKIVKAIIPELRKNGILTLSIPYELGIPEKINWINNTGFHEQYNDILIQISLNNADGKKSGCEVYYKSANKNKADNLSRKILDSVRNSTSLKAVGSIAINQDFLHAYPILNVNPISVIVKCAYLDNDSDVNYLRNEANINLIAKAITNGILNYLNIKTKSTQFSQQYTQQYIKQNQKKSEPKIHQFQSQGVQQFYKPNISSLNPYQPFAPPSSDIYMSSRDERKEMIRRTYVKILGREPNQSDLNYFLNAGITEDQLIKKMIDSQEHVDLIKARQEVLIIKAKFHAQQAELIQLRAEIKDKLGIINNLNNLLTQKNLSIMGYQRRLSVFKRQQNSVDQNSSKNKETKKYKISLIDRLFGFFAKRLC